MSVLGDLIRGQPPSNARTAFAWRLAVGPALARVTTVEQTGSTVVVRVVDARWTVEIERARDVILGRLARLLGPDAVTSLRVTS